MSTLQEGQSLLERIQEVSLKCRLLHHQQHATTGVCEMDAELMGGCVMNVDVTVVGAGGCV